MMSALSNPIHVATVHEGSAAEQRLTDLGIKRDRLNAALGAGDSASRQADKYSPATAAGTYRWMSTVQMLRLGLADDGWEANNDRNSPRAVSPDGKLAIVPVRGTAATGSPERHPRTANPRGNATSRAVQINGQLEFSITAYLADMAAESTGGLQTWFLLYHPAQDGELRAELSLPVDISDKGLVTAWTERIILPTLNFGAEKIVPLDSGGSDELDFDIAAV